jgi:hypothetical protein
VNGIDRFGSAILAFSDKAGEITGVADDDPDCPLAQAFAAMAWLSSETTAGREAARPYLDRARALAPAANAREQRIILGAEQWSDRNLRAAAGIIDEMLSDYPSDLISAKICQGLYFDLGDAPGMLRAPLKVSEACADSAYTHGLLAFGYEECHLLDRAEAAALKAIDIQRAEPWAHHAYAHVCEGRGALEKGAAFMRDQSETWQGLTSFMYTHNWWHLCLFYVDMDRFDEALEIFDTHVWAVDKTCVQDQINAISLLYRLERLGVDPGDRWEEIAEYVAERASDQISVFLDLQFLYALARAGRTETDVMLKNIAERAANAAPHEQIPWQDVAAVAAPAIVALARGDANAAWHAFALVIPQLAEIGGSHAQRDLMRLFHLDALIAAGKLSRAQRILEIRRLGRPDVGWIQRSLHKVYSELGLQTIADSYAP